MVVNKFGQKDASSFNLYLATFAVNLAATSAGCAITWTSPTLPKLYQPNDRITITVEQGAWIGSLLPLGAAFGPLAGTVIVDRIGRKSSILLCSVLFLIHWGIIAFINTLEAIYLARFIAGMAVGGVFGMLPAYVAEIAPLEVRGMMGSMFCFFGSAGCLSSYVVGPYTSISTTICVCATIPLVFILLFIRIPESPYYLLGKGRKDAAYEAMRWLRGCTDKDVIGQELSQIQELLDKSHRENLQSRSSILQLFHSSNLKCLYCAWTLIFLQQTAGINAVVFYSESIFQQSSSKFPASVSAIIVGSVMLCTTFVAPFAGKMFRIKHILYASASSCFLCMTILSIYFNLQSNDVTDDVHKYFGWIPIVSLIGYMFFHLIGLGSYSFVIVAEIFHPNVKTLGSALTTTVCWLTSFVVTRFFSTMLRLIGSAGTFGLFGGFCLLTVLFLIFQLPDTQGKSFQQIQDMIAGDNRVADDKNVNPNRP